MIRPREDLAAAETPGEAGLIDLQISISIRGRILHPSSCRPLWAQYELGEATKNETLRATVRNLMNLIAAAAESKRALNIPTVQQVLPWIDAFQETGEPRFTKAAKTLLEDYVLPSWDTPSHPICNGDGALLSAVRATRCADEQKYPADTAWLMWIMSGFENSEFFIRPQRETGQ